MKMYTICFRVVLVIHFLLVKGQVDQVCYHALGMQDKRIPDDYVTASSSHARGTGSRYARLNRDEGDGAWCPSGNIGPDSNEEYLQIQLPTRSLVTRIATQGRYSQGMGREYTRNYRVEYSRDGEKWVMWSNKEGVEILKGNSDTSSIQLQSFNPGLIGVKYVRIIPYSVVSTPACLRVELYGCVWNSGLVSYDTPTPEVSQNQESGEQPIMFSDDSYDGEETESWFTQGLGQLSDGVKGNGDLSKTLSRYYHPAYGYDYVGWIVGDEEEIEMIFRFDAYRNFSRIRLFSYVNDELEARAIDILESYFSIDGQTYSYQLNFNARNSDGPVLRTYDLPLRSSVVCKAIKLIFQMPRGRLLLSEVEFYNDLLSSEAASRFINNPSSHEEDGENVVVIGGPGITIEPTEPPSAGDNTAMIVGVLIGVIVLLVLIVLALFYRQRKLQKTRIPPSYLFHSSNRSDVEPIVTLAPRIQQRVEAETKVPIYHEIHSAEPHSSDNIYHEPSDAVRITPPPPYQATEKQENNDFPQAHYYGNHNDAQSHHVETDLFVSKVFDEPIQGVSGNNIYAVPWTDPTRRKNRNKRKKGVEKNLGGERSSLLAQYSADDVPPEFSRKKLNFIEKLGEGQFGEVHLCRADASIRSVADDDEFSLPGSSTSPVLVAVKILRENASNNAKDDFLKEVRVMSRLLHPNIVRLLAVCTTDGPYAMVTEYMEHGDLNQYLQDFDDEMTPVPGKRIIRVETLIKMAVQITSGMDYLSSLNFVHRDLATRNCLVGAGDQLRIGDFGMSRNMYQSDYYRIQGRAVLPIRWMSWECVLMGKFSSASDVWSFGVTLWEMYSLCRHQPYFALDDQKVIENLHHMHKKTGQEVYLPRPKRCPASLYNMIRQCWKRECGDRPTFSQLLSYFLERQHTSKASPKPKRPQVKPPVPIKA